MTERARDYLDMGVAHVWVLDPFSNQAYEFGNAGLYEVITGSLTVPELRFDLLLTELFTDLAVPHKPRHDIDQSPPVPLRDRNSLA